MSHSHLSFLKEIFLHRKQTDEACGSRRSKRRSPRPSRIRPCLELLEDRTVPSIVVTTPSDLVSHSGLSLREALVQANALAAANYPATIAFDSSLSGATITLSQGQLELSGGTLNANGGGTITIDAGGLSNPITVNANHASRVFTVDPRVRAVFNGLVITGGNGSGPFTDGGGGGIFNNGYLTLLKCTLTGNSANWGGGIHSSLGTLTVNNCAIHTNSATNSGGGIQSEMSTVTVNNSTIASNTSNTSYLSGGGLYINSFGDSNYKVFLSNSTIAANSNGGILNLNNSTVTLANTIVANNQGTNFDVFGAVTGHHNLIGLGAGMTGITNGVDGNLVDVNPSLGSLQNNGGPTSTMALLSGSPAIGVAGWVTTLTQNAGPTDQTIFVQNASAIASTPGRYSILVDGEVMEVTSVNLSNNSLTVTRAINGVIASPSQGDMVFFAYDQRGSTRGNPPDMGAYQFNVTPPGLPTITNISTTSGPTVGGTIVTISGANLGSMNSAVVRFGSSQGTVQSNNGSTLVVASPPHAVGKVTVAVATMGGVAAGSSQFTYNNVPLTVNTTSDTAGHAGLSLRDAILQANPAAVAGASITIGFDPSLAGSTITLAQGQLDLNGAGNGRITIDGRGLSSPVIISGNNSSRVFQVEAGVQAAFYNLHVSAGNAGQYPNQEGGGIYNLGTLTLSGNTLDYNHAKHNGGAIYNSGTLTMNGNFVQNNSQSGYSPQEMGDTWGAAGVYNSGTLYMSGNTVSNNTAEGQAAGILSAGTLMMSGDTVAGNNKTGITTTTGTAVVMNAVVSGNTGGINNRAVLTVCNSTISGNSGSQGWGIMYGAYGGGAGIFNFGTLTVHGSTLSNNTTTGYGGGILNNGGSFTVSNSTFYQNSALDGGGIFNYTYSSYQNTVSNSTFYLNTASQAGGIGGIYIHTSKGLLTMLNTFMWDTPYDLDRYPDTNTRNILGTSNTMNSLANNGGPTQTCSLKTGSPAIGAGGAVTSLAMDISSSVTSFAVGLGSAIARSPGRYLIKIDNEVMLVTNVSGNSLTVIRGYNGTTAATHTASISVYLATDQRGYHDTGAHDIGAYQSTVASSQAPGFLSSSSTSFTLGTAGSFTVLTSGWPVPTLSLNGNDALPVGISYNPVTGVLSGTPGPGSSGAYTLHFTAQNGGGSTQQTFTLNVNEPPQFTSVASTTFNANIFNTFTVTASGFPAPNFSKNSSDTLPTGVTFDTSTGILSGTPAHGTGGLYTLHLTAQNAGGSTNQTFYLTVNDTPTVPTFTSQANTIFNEGKPGSFTVTASGWPVPTLSENITDSLPSGVTFNASTGVLSGTPSNGSHGTYTLNFTAQNTAGSTPQTFYLKINALPTFTSAATVNVPEGSTSVQTVTATDVDDGSLAFSLAGGADQGKFNMTSGGGLTFKTAPNYETPGSADGDNIYFVTVQVDDGHGYPVTQNLTITVTNINEPPTAEANGAYNITEGQALVLNSTGSGDPDVGDNLTYAWDLDNDGQYDDASGANPTVSWSTLNTMGFNDGPSTHTIGLKITDSQGLPGTDAATVNLANSPPTIAEGESIGVTMSENSTPTPFALTLHASDLGNDTLTWSLVTSPNRGQADVSGSGTTKVVNYTPTDNYQGTDSFVVRVTDKDGAADNITVNVAINPNTLFADDFNRADNSYPGASWNQVFGGGVIKNNRLLTGSASLNLLLANGVSESQVRIQADATLSSTGVQQVGLFARQSGPGDQNMYLGRLVANNGVYTAYILRNVGGTWTVLASQVVSSGSGQLRFEVVGPSLKLFWKNAQVASAIDSALTATGAVGLRVGSGTTIDNFRVDRLTFNNTAMPISDLFEHGQGVPLSSPWVTAMGSFSEQGGKAFGGTTGNLAVLASSIPADVAVQTDIALPTTGTHSAGLVSRYSGSGRKNLYFAYISAVNGKFTAYLYKYVNGTATKLSSMVLGSATGTLRLETFGNSLKLFLNNNLITSAFDSSLTSGVSGIWAGQGDTLDNFQANALNVTPVALTFTDNFNPTSDNQLSRSWMERSGNFGVQSGRVQSFGASSLATINQETKADIAVQANLALPSVGAHAAGLVGRYAGPAFTNLYLGRVVGNNGVFTAQIMRNLKGTWTVLASAPVTSGIGILRFEMVGTSLKLFLNGKLATYAFDSTLKTGVAGIYAIKGDTLAAFSASAITTLPETLTFTDSFNLDNGSQLSRSWVEKSGNFSVQGSALRANATTVNLASVAGVSEADVAVEANVVLSSSGAQSAGLIARYTGSGDSNMYYGRVTGNTQNLTASIYRNINGVWTLLATKTGLSGTGKLRFEVLGFSLRLIWQGTVVASAMDYAITTAGTVGIRSGQGSVIDDFTASELTP